jgi:DNA repair exonuclease SbcCD ATPase subunit
MLELKSVTWQNFLSYGDYPTTLELDNLGQCLIIGEVIDEDSKSSEESGIRRSNGAGKSTIPSVIQWVLFGRTMHSRTPGNNVVNWFTGRDCWAKVVFKNGDSITRTRNTDGKNELLFSKDGDETRLTSDTLSTAANQQNQLNKLFNLDWEIFCGSVFFNQYGKPWMEMADATRKKAIERVLHVDRLTYYAQAAKTKCDSIDKLVERQRTNVDNFKSTITRLEGEIERIDTASKTFIDNQLERVASLKEQAAEELRKRDAINLPDIEGLKAKWDVMKKVEAKLLSLRRERDSAKYKLAEASGNKTSIVNKIKLWNDKAGKVCVSCEQAIEQSHISSKIDPIKEELQRIQERVEELNDKVNEIQSTIDKADAMLIDRKPSMSIEDAESTHSRFRRHEQESKKLLQQADKVSKESNPHEASKADVLNRISKAKEDIKSCEEELQRSDLLNKHYHYVYKAYNDRSKIKSYIFKEHIPFINARLKHYLEVFDLDIKIELTEGLGIKSSMWGYEFESGGERKRTDVAFMLAMFDFHEQMYGRQCNVLVLDEVDGRLDDEGIDALINIIKTDLSHRVESILMISHRNMMFDTFSKELRVFRKDRFSTLEVI